MAASYTFVGATVVAPAAATGVANTVNKPVGSQAGDLLICIFAGDNTTGNVTAMVGTNAAWSGFTYLPGPSSVFGASDHPGSAYMTAYYPATNPANFSITVTFSSHFNNLIVILAYRAVPRFVPSYVQTGVGGQVGGVTNSNIQSNPADSNVAGTQPQALIHAWLLIGTGPATFTPDASESGARVNAQQSSTQLIVTDELISGVGATYPQRTSNFNWGFSSSNWAIQCVRLIPQVDEIVGANTGADVGSLPSWAMEHWAS